MLKFISRERPARMMIVGMMALLCACGTQTVTAGHQTTSRSAEGDAARSALDVCGGLIDKAIYTSVIQGKEVTADQLRNWYRTRNNGVYSPSQVADIPPTGVFFVCELSASGLVKGPPPPDPSATAATVDLSTSTAAILVVGVKPDAILDSFGPETTSTELMAKLG